MVGMSASLFKLVIRSVFNNSLGPSSGSEIEIFRKFQARWPHLRQNNYEPCIK